MLWSFLAISHLVLICQSLILYTVTMVTDCWKRRRRISVHGPCSVSSFATVSAAHVRFTEHGSIPQCLLARRAREWRMRWQLHVSVSSLMTQQSCASHSLPHSFLLCPFSLSCPGHPVFIYLPDLLLFLYTLVLFVQTHAPLYVSFIWGVSKKQKRNEKSVLSSNYLKICSVHLQGNNI